MRGPKKCSDKGEKGTEAEDEEMQERRGRELHHATAETEAEKTCRSSGSGVDCKSWHHASVDTRLNGAGEKMNRRTLAPSKLYSKHIFLQLFILYSF